jgi:ferredoxin-NADP reductase/cytochrome P450/CRP-like cAMP-binding protein
VIVRAGGVARAMYVLLVGHVQVYVEDEAGRARVLAKLGPGAYFGEQALLPGRDGRRNASARAHSLVVLARIDRAALGDLLQQTGGLTERLAAVGDAQLARRLAEETALRLDLVDAATLEGSVERALRDGEVVFRKGDLARDVYLVLRGTVAVYDEGALLTRLEAGQCFGELALTRRGPRAATVVAEGEAAVLAIDGTRFLDLHERSPTLRRTLSTFERAYALPRRGLVTQFAGDLEGEPCLTVVYELPDGRGAMASLATEREVYRLDVRDPRRDAGAPTTRHAFRDPAGAVEREITLDARGVVAALASVGRWPELSLLHELAVEGRPLPEAALHTFAEDGAVALRVEAAPEADPLCCRCTGVRRSAIEQARADGCATLPQLRTRLGCGSICGGCVPSLQEILGDEVWTAADVVEEVPLTAEVRAFRLKPSGGAPRSFQPGQHLVIRARIDGAQVERAYTLTSPARGAGYYEVSVKREPMGLFSRWLFDGGARGATLQVAGPQGDVCWDGGARPVVCVVAGIGVTPAVAILRARALTPGAGPLHVHYSVRARAEAPYLDEILAAAADPAVRVTLRETATQGRLGREDLARIAESSPDADWFLCGPNRFLDTVAALLAGLGVAKGRVHVERFVHAGDVPLIAPPDPSAAEDVLQAPVAPPPASLGDTVAARSFRALDPYLSSTVEAGAGGVVQPRHRWVERALIRAAGIDPRLPSLYGTAASLVAVGAYASQLRAFARPSRYVENRALARAAVARGAPLPADTPDGDTFIDLVPSMALPQFEGPGGVATGWKRSAEGAILPGYCTRAPSAIRAFLGDSRTADRGAIPYHYVQQAMGIPRRCPVAGGPAGIFGGCYHDNATWTLDRATTMDHLAPSSVEGHTPVLTASLADVEAAIDAMIAGDPRRAVDLSVMMRQVALRLVLRVLFGRSDDRDQVRVANEVIAAVNLGLTHLAPVSLGVPGHIAILEACIATARQGIARMVDEMRARAVAGELTPNQQELPVVQRLLALVNGAPIAQDRLYPLLLPLVVAGHETSAHALSWAFYHLARDPVLARHVRAEIDAYRAWRSGGPIRLVDYDRRPWTLALFLETTRLYSLIAYTTRVTQKAGEIPPNPATGIGGFRYPKGAEIIVSILGAHLDPETYADPLAFRPQRFLEGIDPSLPAHRHGRAVRQRAWDLEAAGALVGFGAGPAECPGRGMAMFEFFLVVDHLFGRFDVELVDPSREVRVGKELLSAPEPGAVAARIRRRAPATP